MAESRDSAPQCVYNAMQNRSGAESVLSECVDRIEVGEVGSHRWTVHHHHHGWLLASPRRGRLIRTVSAGVITTRCSSFSTAGDCWKATHASCTLFVFQSDLAFDHVHACCLGIVFFFFFYRMQACVTRISGGSYRG